LIMIRCLRHVLFAIVLFIPVSGLADEVVAPENPIRRFESVFFITLPFTSLYSGILMLGISAVIQRGNVNFNIPLQTATAVLAVGGAAFSAWRDTSAGGVPPEKLSLGNGDGLAIQTLAFSSPAFSGNSPLYPEISNK
jgi:hypothetical protein